MVNMQTELSEKDALRAHPESGCPALVLADQVLLCVNYVTFSGNEDAGQIIVHKDVADDIKKVFDLIYKIKFPLAKVIPIAHPRYLWDDEKSCDDNNSSAFNYRKIAGLDKLSNHSFGLAVDLNPVQNPYIRYDESGNEVFRAPASAVYDKEIPGTLYAGHPVVVLFNDLGWEWGGDWTREMGRTDYQHFEKHISS